MLTQDEIKKLDQSNIGGSQANAGKSLLENLNLGGSAAAAPPPQPSMGRRIYDAVTHHEQLLGSSMGAATFKATGGMDELNKAIQERQVANQKLVSTLTTKVQTGRAAGQDTSHIEGIIKDLINENTDTVANLVPEAVRSPEQVAGSALGVAADIGAAGAVPGLAGSATGATGLIPGAIQGAKVGATAGGVFGAVQGAAGAMEENRGALDVAGGALKGGATGAVVGGVVGGVTGGVAGALKDWSAKAGVRADAKALENLKNSMSPEEWNKQPSFIRQLDPSNMSEQERQVLHSHLEALQSQVSEQPTGGSDQFIHDLVTPQQKGGELLGNIKAGRVEEGGLVTGRTVQPTKGDMAIEDAVSKVPGIRDTSTNLEAVNAIHDEIEGTAKSLRSAIKSSPTQLVVTQDQMDTFLGGVQNDIQRNSLLVGDSEKTAQKILTKFNDLLSENSAGGDITAENILDSRQQLDKWITTQRPKAFDQAYENALSAALRPIRQGANDLLAENAPDVAVKELLKKQSLLYQAIDNIAPKAMSEAQTGVGRILQAHPILKKIPLVGKMAEVAQTKL